MAEWSWWNECRWAHISPCRPSLDTYAHTCSSSELNGCLQWFKTIQYVLSQRLIKQGKFGEYPKGIDETEQILHSFVTEITTCSHYERTNNPSDTDKILHVFSGMNKLHSSYSSHPKQHRGGCNFPPHLE